MSWFFLFSKGKALDVLERFLKKHDDPPSEALRFYREEGKTIIEAGGRCMLCGNLYSDHDWTLTVEDNIRITANCGTDPRQ